MDYLAREQDCIDAFFELGPVFNTCTPENHPVIFKTEEDYKTGMSIFGICAKLFPRIGIYAFQLMSNHIHFVASGDEDEIDSFFDFFTNRLDKNFEGRIDFSLFKLKKFAVKDINYFRNAIVYVNRNGFVVNENVTPFSYPWESSAYYFQPMASKYVKAYGKPLGISRLREIMHSKYVDSQKDIIVVDGYVTPLGFCYISKAEKIFKNPKQYFFKISKDVELYSEIAKSIGESIYYNDSDLYNAAVRIVKEKFGTKDLNTLPSSQKLDLAKQLHFDYNATDKQIHRLLKIDLNILKSLF